MKLKMSLRLKKKNASDIRANKPEYIVEKILARRVRNSKVSKSCVPNLRLHTLPSESNKATNCLLLIGGILFEMARFWK